MAWFLYGIILWGVIHLFQGLILFFGMIQGAEYAGPVVKFLIRQDQPAFELGRGDVLDRVSFTLAMLGGSDFINATYVLTLLIQVLTYAQIGLWIVGYATALQGVELVESGKGQLISLFTLSGSNFLFAFFLIFLPLVGAYSYVLMPLWGTEMAMCYFNQDRSTPLHIFWSYAPFWEELLTLIVLVCRYGEPIMMAYFVWTVAAALKDEPLEKMAQGTFQMGLAILFLLIAFNLFSLTGNSPVLVRVLRILYLMWYVFMIGWILRMVGMVAKCRETFSFYFNPDAD